MPSQKLRSACCLLVVVPITVAAGCGDDAEGQPSQCEAFLQFTKSCYESAGMPVQVNSAACSDTSLMTPVIQAQIDCGMKYKDTWCELIQTSVNPDGGTLDPRDPEILALNACIAERTTASPCKEAIHVLAACGTYLGFVPECIESAPAIAQCILDHPESACAALGGTSAEAGATAGQAYQQCVQDAYSADAGAD